jgi:hypothetical protein
MPHVTGRGGMIRNSKQNWAVGSQVKVGFLTLVVKAAIATRFNEIFAA